MKKFAALIMLSLLILSACRKEMNVEPDPQQTDTLTMSTMEVSDDFDWKTLRDIEVNVTSKAQAVLYIKSSNEEQIYHKALIQPGILYPTLITIPSCETELIFSAGAQKQRIVIGQGIVTVVFN